MKYVCKKGDVESVLALKLTPLPFVTDFKEISSERQADDDENREEITNWISIIFLFSF